VLCSLAQNAAWKRYGKLLLLIVPLAFLAWFLERIKN